MVKQEKGGSLPYPKKGSINRFIYKLPLLLWRLGFGPFLSHPARGGRKMLVVTTLGRKSKRPRHTMLSYTVFDKKHYVISGWGLRSDWVRNLQADPLVTIQVGYKIYSAYARKVEDLEESKGVAQNLFDSGGDSHFGSWLDALEIEQNLNDLINKRQRVYFVGFDPADIIGPDPLTADLIWIWAVFISFLLGLFFFLWN
jgi:deazaflavin-dependent oxidoreductase (nitroreductase family)